MKNKCVKCIRYTDPSLRGEFDRLREIVVKSQENQSTAGI